jgi:hypothetical protein
MDKKTNNRLYENDLIDIVKCYWGHRSNFYFCKTSQAAERGDIAEIDRCLSFGLDALNRIEKLLSTRRDYYLQDQIADVESYPGSNSFSSRMIRKACINEEYPGNDVYELFHFFYIPRVKAWGEYLRAKLVKGEGISSVGDGNPRWREFTDYWMEGSIVVPEDNKFRGNAIQALSALYDSRELTCE